MDAVLKKQIIELLEKDQYREDLEEYIYDIFKRDVNINNDIYGICLGRILEKLKTIERYMLDENKEILSEDSFIKSISRQTAIINAFVKMTPCILFVGIVVDDFNKWAGDGGANKSLVLGNMWLKVLLKKKFYTDILEMISKMSVESKELLNEWEENSKQIPNRYLGENKVHLSEYKEFYNAQIIPNKMRDSEQKERENAQIISRNSNNI